MELNINLNGTNFTIEKLNQLNILVGTNGSGKSLVNKLVFCCSTVLNILSYDEEEECEENIKEILESCLYEIENSKLELEYIYDEGYLKLIYDKGKILYKCHAINVPKEDLPMSRYLSTSTRKFKDVENILRLSESTCDFVEFFKNTGIPLYDVLYCNELKNRFNQKDYVIFKSDVSEKFKMEYNIDCIGIQFRDGVFYFKNKEGVEKQLKHESDGTQALINMFSLLT